MKRRLAEFEGKLQGKRPDEISRELDKLKKDLADKDKEIDKLKKKLADLEA